MNNLIAALRKKRQKETRVHIIIIILTDMLQMYGKRLPKCGMEVNPAYCY